LKLSWLIYDIFFKQKLQQHIDSIIERVKKQSLKREACDYLKKTVDLIKAT
jgi:hypothetical protein